MNAAVFLAAFLGALLAKAVALSARTAFMMHMDRKGGPDGPQDPGRECEACHSIRCARCGAKL